MTRDPNPTPASGSPACPAAEVIIPTYNDGDRVLAAVESALHLGFVRRVIVVDDGSDSRPPIEANDRVLVLRIENSGPSAARNAGLDASAAPFVIFCDADDTLTPGAERVVQDAARTAAAVTLCGRVENHADGRTVEREPPAEWADDYLPEPGCVWRPIWLFGTPGAVVSRAVIDAGVRFDPELRNGEDREFFRRCADHGPIFISRAIGVRYALGDGTNVSGRKHLDRAALDFVRTLRRYTAKDGALEREDYWIARFTWLINQLAKHGRSCERWDEMAGISKERGWAIPLRSKLRHVSRRLRGLVR